MDKFYKKIQIHFTTNLVIFWLLFVEVKKAFAQQAQTFRELVEQSAGKDWALNMIVYMVLANGMIVMSFVIAQKLGGYGADTIVGWGKQLKKKAEGTVERYAKKSAGLATGAVTGTARWAGRETAGRFGQWRASAITDEDRIMRPRRTALREKVWGTMAKPYQEKMAVEKKRMEAIKKPGDRLRFMAGSAGEYFSPRMSPAARVETLKGMSTKELAEAKATLENMDVKKIPNGERGRQDLMKEIEKASERFKGKDKMEYEDALKEEQNKQAANKILTPDEKAQHEGDIGTVPSSEPERKKIAQQQIVDKESKVITQIEKIETATFETDGGKVKSDTDSARNKDIKTRLEVKAMALPAAEAGRLNKAMGGDWQSDEGTRMRIDALVKGLSRNKDRREAVAQLISKMNAEQKENFRRSLQNMDLSSIADQDERRGLEEFREETMRLHKNTLGMKEVEIPAAILEELRATTDRGRLLDILDNQLNNKQLEALPAGILNRAEVWKNLSASHLTNPKLLEKINTGTRRSMRAHYTGLTGATERERGIKDWLTGNPVGQFYGR